MLCGLFFELIPLKTLQTLKTSQNAPGESKEDQFVCYGSLDPRPICLPSVKFHLHVVALAPGLFSSRLVICKYFFIRIAVTQGDG